jgi:hypothetical protein
MAPMTSVDDDHRRRPATSNEQAHRDNFKKEKGVTSEHTRGGRNGKNEREEPVNANADGSNKPKMSERPHNRSSRSGYGSERPPPPPSSPSHSHTGILFKNHQYSFAQQRRRQLAEELARARSGTATSLPPPPIHFALGGATGATGAAGSPACALCAKRQGIFTCRACSTNVCHECSQRCVVCRKTDRCLGCVRAEANPTTCLDCVIAATAAATGPLPPPPPPPLPLPVDVSTPVTESAGVVAAPPPPAPVPVPVRQPDGTIRECDICGDTNVFSTCSVCGRSMLCYSCIAQGFRMCRDCEMRSEQPQPAEEEEDKASAHSVKAVAGLAKDG